MSLSVWEYVRRRSCDAFLAGVQDALDQLERQDQSQLIFAVAKTLRRKLQEAAGNGGNNGKPESRPLFEKQPPESQAHAPAVVEAKPPQISSQPQPAIANGRPPQNSAQPDANQRRPPGRPRKETHG